MSGNLIGFVAERRQAMQMQLKWTPESYYRTLSVKKKYLVYTAVGQIGSLHISEQYRSEHILFVFGSCPSCGERVDMSAPAKNLITTQCGHVTFDDHGLSIGPEEFWPSNHAPSDWQRDSEDNKAYLDYSVIGQVGSISVAKRVDLFSETVAFFINGSCPACSKSIREHQYTTLKYVSSCGHVDLSYESFHVHLPAFPNFSEDILN